MTELLTIEALVAGGEGLARGDSGVVFVPLTVPGDRVRVEVSAERSGARHGRIVELVEPGPGRVSPPCPHVGTCGGCDWQQVSYDTQLTQKRDLVREALRRVGGLPDVDVQPTVPSSAPFRYRRRLRAQLVGGGWGFAERASNKAVRVDACLLVEQRAEELATLVAPELKKAKLGAVLSFSIDTDDAGRGALFVELGVEPSSREEQRVSRLLNSVPGLKGIVLAGPEGKAKVVGEPIVVDSVRRLRARPDLFAQANRAGARALAEACAATVTPDSKVLELFAGSGTITLALAERTPHIVATEGDGPALDLLRLSLNENKRSARIVAGKVTRVLDGLVAEGARFDHVVLDPPRTGAKEIIGAIAKLGATRVTYVSCDPATFARDAALLVRDGFRLTSVTPWDLFPQTHHVELLGVLER